MHGMGMQRTYGTEKSLYDKKTQKECSLKSA